MLLLVAAATTLALATLGALAAPSTMASAEEVALLRDWQRTFAASLEEMRAADLQSCGGGDAEHALQHCEEALVRVASTGLRDHCAVTVRQDVQRFGRFRFLVAEGEAQASLELLAGALRAERLEVTQRERQLRQLLAFLEGEFGAEPFSEAEVQTHMARANSNKVFAQGGDSIRRVAVSVGPQSPAAERHARPACDFLLLAKPSALVVIGLAEANHSSAVAAAHAAAAEGNPIDAAGYAIAQPADLELARSRADSLYMSAFTVANNRYAADHQLITYTWLYFLSAWAWQEPCSNSGPLMPEASCRIPCSLAQYGGGRVWGIEFLPCWNMFGPGVSLASPLGIILETANPGASSWFTCCEHGLLDFCPASMARSSCWMVPGVGNIGQLIPGRMLQDRTVCGSHPSGCSDFSGQPDIHSAMETYLAPASQGYDADLVDVLSALASANASFGRVTFFTTSLTQLAALGWQPRSIALQHHGVQLTLRDEVPAMPWRRPFEESGVASSSARVLTVEMMAEGLLWSLRAQELRTEDVHSTEMLEFDNLRPEVIADYVLDQKGTTYRDANCQLYARHLMDRLLIHGGRSKNAVIKVGSREEMSPRFYCMLALAGLAVIASAAAQWALFWRVATHVRRVPADAKWRFTALAHVAEALTEDAAAAEAHLSALCGLRCGHAVSTAAWLAAAPSRFTYIY